MGSSVVGDPGGDAATDIATEDASDQGVARDVIDAASPGCRGNGECDDGVACTVDACRAGRCEHAPTTELCPSGSACEIARGCRPVRSCRDDTGCRDDDPCTVAERCDLTLRTCAFDELPAGTPCGAAGSDRSCRGGACQCPADRTTSCSDRCVDARTDPEYCGRCGNACAAGAWCRDGDCACPAPQVHCPGVGCVDTRVDTGHCGACGSACPAGAQCIEGRCLSPCAAGTHRCGTACLTDNSPASCGTHCEPCVAPTSGVATCTLAGTSGTCDFTCNAGTHRCSDRCAPDDAVASCGDRCQPCFSPDNGAVVCAAGRCVITCAAGFHLCGERCLSDVATASCGERCEPCATTANGAPSCLAGACGITCNAGFRLCGDLCSDGTSPLACGPSCTRCRIPTNGRATCAAGACGFACDPGTHRCGDDCARDDAPQSCGGRCEPCPAPANSRATCAAGACGFACDPGYVRAGDGCRELPRLEWPTSDTHVTSRRPTLRWRLPAGLDPDAADSVVEVCRDRACGTVIDTLRARGGRGVPATDLPRGTVFWRVRAGGLSSAVWSFAAGGPDTPAGSNPGAGATWGVTPDFNGDGFDDLAVGQPQATPGPGVVVYPGGASGLRTDAAVMLAPPSDAAGFGLSVAAIGDVNGDGFCDLAVGAPAALRDVGQVFIYHGSLGGLRSEPDAVLNGADPAMSQFGSVISGGGDVNGDGFADLIVGAPQAMVLGRAYVYYGSARGLSPTPSTLSPSDTGMAGFGVSIADVGDLDGDGFSDVVVGANLVDGWAGAAYVFCGAAGGPPPLPTARMTRPEGGQFGSAAAGAGDVDADGLPDFALSAPGFFEARGRAYLYPGNRARRWIDPAVVLEGAGGRLADFGTALASAGDVDGDGDDDLLVSAPRRGDEVGSVYLFAGSRMGLSETPAQAFDGDAAGAYFGSSLTGARDLDHDGFSDAAFGAERLMSSRGRVTVYRGSAAGLGSPTALPGPSSGARFGVSLAWLNAARPPASPASRGRGGAPG
nr:FG-GAP repeat protein [Deltaproteobacteria bacterium]